MKYRTLGIAILLLAAVGCKSTWTANVPRGNSRVMISATGNRYQKAIIDEARGWIGTPYVYGGTSKKGTDCSGFVMQVFNNAVGIKIPRNSAAQSDYCRRIKRSELAIGDLVFFSSKRAGGRVSHVGLFVGNGNFIHASSSRGVMVSNLDDQYFKTYFLHAGRVEQFAKMSKRAPKTGTPIPTITIDELAQQSSKPKTSLADLDRAIEAQIDSIYNVWADDPCSYE